jgi:NAD(P)-dependent dehydrogenase (short-subunit alcohol dehydrogenase family)
MTSLSPIARTTAQPIRPLPGVQAAGARCVLAKADITRQRDVERLFSVTAEQLGMVTGVVNNAGATAHIGDLADTPVHLIRHVIDVNVLGVILCARQASKIMSIRRGGHGGAIVNVSSAAATLGSPHEYVHYAAAKAAVEALTIGLAKELALTRSASTQWHPGRSVPLSMRQQEIPAALTASPGTYRSAGPVNPRRSPQPSPGCSAPKPHM